MARIKKSVLFKKTNLGPRTPFTPTPKFDYEQGYTHIPSKKTHRVKRVTSRDHSSKHRKVAAYYLDPKHPRYREFRIGTEEGAHRGYWGGYVKYPMDGYPGMHVFHMHDLSTAVRNKGPKVIYQVSLSSHQGILPRVRYGIWSGEGRRGYVYSDLTDPKELKHVLGLHRDALKVLNDEHGPNAGQSVLFEGQPRLPKNPTPKQILFYQIQNTLTRAHDWEKMVDTRGRVQLPGPTIKDQPKRMNTQPTHIGPVVKEIISDVRKRRANILNPEPRYRQAYLFGQRPAQKGKKAAKKPTQKARAKKVIKTKSPQVQQELKFKKESI